MLDTVSRAPARADAARTVGIGYLESHAVRADPVRGELEHPRVDVRRNEVRFRH